MSKCLAAHELLDCINTGDLETGRDDDVFYLQIRDDRIFEAPVSAHLIISHDLKTEVVTVYADWDVPLTVECNDRESAVEVAGLLGRCLFVPID